MKYSDIATFPDRVDLEMQGGSTKRNAGERAHGNQADFNDSKRRLLKLNRDRLELLAILVDRELRRHLSADDYERLQLEKRLGGTHRARK